MNQVLVRMQKIRFLAQEGMGFPQKIKNRATIRSGNSTSGSVSTLTLIKIIHNNQVVETT